jgi:nucleotide-binding universal stress UspA family protein
MRTHHLVVGYDRSELSHLAFEHAQAVARGAPRAEITVLQVLNFPLPSHQELIAFANDQFLVDTHRAGLLEDFKAVAFPEHVTLTVDARFGDPATEICDVAREKEADFIFVGTHGRRGLEHLLLGSVAEQVCHRAPCTVIAVRPREADSVPRVEAPCPLCTAAKQEAGSEKVWCARHTHARYHAPHLHYQYPDGGYGRGSMTIRP